MDDIVDRIFVHSVENFVIVRLSNIVSFILVSFLKHGQNSQNIKLILWGESKLILVSVQGVPHHFYYF